MHLNWEHHRLSPFFLLLLIQPQAHSLIEVAVVKAQLNDGEGADKALEAALSRVTKVLKAGKMVSALPLAKLVMIFKGKGPEGAKQAQALVEKGLAMATKRLGRYHRALTDFHRLYYELCDERDVLMDALSNIAKEDSRCNHPCQVYMYAQLGQHSWKDRDLNGAFNYCENAIAYARDYPALPGLAGTYLFDLARIALERGMIMMPLDLCSRRPSIS